jgi:hypothetical protein
LFSEKHILQDTYPETVENAQKERRKRSAEFVFSEMHKTKKWRKPTYTNKLG